MGSSTSGRSRSDRHVIAVTCTPGLEPVCVAELKALGLKPKPAGSGVVECNANDRQLYSANVWLRSANRVTVRVATFRATDFAHLQEHAAMIDWNRWIPSGFAPRFRISTNASKLYHSKAIAQRLHQVSIPPTIGGPEQLFIVRIERNTVTISADSSGQALYLRPWREDTGSAPLRATMASAMIDLAGWGIDDALVDPFCGSGVIGIEAALRRAGLPPGGEREFAFQHWSGFDTGSWASVVGGIQASMDRAQPDGDQARVPILLRDRDAAVLAGARANAESAGVADLIRFEEGVVSHLDGDHGPGHVITNPPYGKRVGGVKLEALYRRLGSVIRERLPAYHTTLITSDSSFARGVDRRLKPVTSFGHGGLRVKIYHRAPETSEIETANAETANAETVESETVESETVKTETSAPELA